jgi:ABC-2 type transport system permease protein
MWRIWALIRRESYQLVRDPSSVAIGIVMPVMLVLLFGYGLSLDVKNVPVAIVLEDSSPDTRELASSFQMSPYFDARLIASMPEARQLMLARKVDGIVRIRPDFSRHLALGDGEVQVLVHGTDANNARIIQAYAQGAVGQWAARRTAEGNTVAGGPVVVRSRLWFNEANDSHYFLVPGLIVLIMTLIGAFLSAMVMAREWERGTLEALFVTPARSDEILLGKTVPYFVLGMIGLFLCIVAAKFLFEIPLRGSIWVLTAGDVVTMTAKPPVFLRAVNGTLLDNWRTPAGDAGSFVVTTTEHHSGTSALQVDVSNGAAHGPFRYAWDSESPTSGVCSNAGYKVCATNGDCGAGTCKFKDMAA